MRTIHNKISFKDYLRIVYYGLVSKMPFIYNIDLIFYINKKNININPIPHHVITNIDLINLLDSILFMKNADIPEIKNAIIIEKNNMLEMSYNNSNLLLMIL